MTSVATALELSPLVGGRHIATGDTYEVRSPYDGAPVALVHRAGPAQIEAAIAGAVRAFETTRKLPSWKRAEVLGRTADAIEAGRDDFARTIALEAGKPLKASRLEAERAAFTFRVAAEEAKRNYGEIVPLDWLPGNDGPRRPRAARPARPGRRHHAVQLPAQPRLAQGRAGARRGQPDPAAAGEPDAGQLVQARGDHPRGRVARGGHRRRPVEHAGRRSARRRRAHQPADLHRQPRRRLGR